MVRTNWYRWYVQYERRFGRDHSYKEAARVRVANLKAMDLELSELTCFRSLPFYDFVRWGY